MEIRQYDVWLADLNPRIGTETGKIRPVLILQSNLLNNLKHSATIILPITVKIAEGSEILRVRLNSDITGLIKESDIMIDQIRAIDNKRLSQRIGSIPPFLIKTINENLKIVLDMDY